MGTRTHCEGKYFWRVKSSFNLDNLWFCKFSLLFVRTQELTPPKALANFSDGYQQSIASSTNVILNLLTTKVYTSAIQTRVSNALLVGSIIGILALGYTSDLYSRKSGIALTSLLVIIGTLISTLTFQISPSSPSYSNILWYLTIARGMAGVGVGGEYLNFDFDGDLWGSGVYIDIPPRPHNLG